MYMGSTDIHQCLPGLGAQNSLDLAPMQPLTSIWLGNQTKVAAHYDFPLNLACNVVGKRTFTLFPPEQISNLYVGPMELAPGGQDISLVDMENPDFERFPRFQQALDASLTAELTPGDVLFIPSMWWHHVEALTHFNLLATFWWSSTDHITDESGNALLYAVMALRNLPEDKRDIWFNLFKHYIFDAAPLDHIPEHAKGMLNPQNERALRKFKDYLINRLRY